MIKPDGITENKDYKIIILNPGPICEEFFGFMPGDMVKTPDGLATVVGVEFSYLNDEFKPHGLWFRLENGELKSWYQPKKKLENFGFVKNRVSTLYDLCLSYLKKIEINKIIIPDIKFRDEVIDLLKTRIREHLTGVKTIRIRRTRFKLLNKTTQLFVLNCMRAEVSRLLEIKNKRKFEAILNM